MTSHRFHRGAVAAVLSLGLLSAWGCSSPARISYIPEGGSYTADDIAVVLENASPGETAGAPASDSADLRQEALADLRTHGEDAAALADALTHQFPVDVNAVPVEVRAGTYEGRPAWIVVESWGAPGERLSSTRLWIFSSEDLSLITALSGQ
ncbi:MAG: hypothetical protein ACYCXR_05575 [Coriobacteriia bacterium]